MAAREMLSVRVAPAGHLAIKQVAARDGITRAEATRRLLAYAARHMPPGWPATAHPAHQPPPPAWG
jgi:antitoxin component of RelBE/YafQ-DinJ toxin-antitoxin module